MNVIALRQVFLSVTACVMAHGIHAAQVEPVPALIRQLTSESPAVRREAVRQLEPGRIGQLEPTLAIQATLIAAQDSDAWIQQTALGGLGWLTSVFGRGDTAASDSAVTRAIAESPDLRPTLERIMSNDPNVEVVIGASVPLMLAFGTDPAAEALVLDRTDRLPSPVDQIRLMGNLAVDGVDAEQTFERLARYLDGAPIIVQKQAAYLLLSRKTLPADRFEDFLRLVETPEGFADPDLVRALPRFGVSPEKYLPRLLELQSRLEEELQRPRDERTLTIYNDAHWKQILDEAIAAARKDTQAKQP